MSSGSYPIVVSVALYWWCSVKFSDRFVFFNSVNAVGNSPDWTWKFSRGNFTPGKYKSYFPSALGSMRKSFVSSMLIRLCRRVSLNGGKYDYPSVSAFFLASAIFICSILLSQSSTPIFWVSTFECSVKCAVATTIDLLQS